VTVRSRTRRPTRVNSDSPPCGVAVALHDQQCVFSSAEKLANQIILALPTFPSAMSRGVYPGWTKRGGPSGVAKKSRLYKNLHSFFDARERTRCFPQTAHFQIHEVVKVRIQMITFSSFANMKRFGLISHALKKKSHFDPFWRSPKIGNRRKLLIIMLFIGSHA